MQNSPLHQFYSCVIIHPPNSTYIVGSLSFILSRSSLRLGSQMKMLRQETLFCYILLFKYKNLALKPQNGLLKIQNGQQKCLNWQHVVQYLLPQKMLFLMPKYIFGVFTPIKNAGVKAFMKLTSGLFQFCYILS